ncbi:hypothetical protein U1Q18_003117 [Sarracenia purpurea var. burkii]
MQESGIAKIGPAAMTTTTMKQQPMIFPQRPKAKPDETFPKYSCPQITTLTDDDALAGLLVTYMTLGPTLHDYSAIGMNQLMLNFPQQQKETNKGVRTEKIKTL